MDTQAKTTVRKIEEIEVREEPLADSGTAMTPVTVNDAEKHTFPEREIVIRVRGRGFLYNMVRIIAGTLMEVGRGQMPPEQVGEILLACDRQAAGPTAPACGLTLIGYEFLKEKVDEADFGQVPKIL